MVSVKFLAGAAVGYVLGTKAGREQYDKIMAELKNGRGSELMEKGRDAVEGVLHRTSDSDATSRRAAADDAHYTSARL